ncbi:Glucan 1,3-beta-glucosidase [Fusarium oxysporum f. sp. albedinis]|nr:Glucan 1,3-beta-glucosidase [Fusarium oxysporum f. sp. albedinis]
MRKPPQRVAGHANSDVCSDTPELAARELAVHPNPPSSPQEDAYKIARSVSCVELCAVEFRWLTGFWKLSTKPHRPTMTSTNRRKNYRCDIPEPSSLVVDKESDDTLHGFSANCGDMAYNIDLPI